MDVERATSAHSRSPSPSMDKIEGTRSKSPEKPRREADAAEDKPAKYVFASNDELTADVYEQLGARTRGAGGACSGTSSAPCESFRMTIRTASGARR